MMLAGQDYFVAKTCIAMHIITFSLYIIKSKLQVAAKALIHFHCWKFLLQFKIVCLIVIEYVDTNSLQKGGRDCN